jgi:hypothetical protein
MDFESFRVKRLSHSCPRVGTYSESLRDARFLGFANIIKAQKKES